MGDRVRPLKLECPSEGGSQTDTYPTELDPTADSLDCNGVYLNVSGTADTAVQLGRTASSSEMQFTDAVAGTVKLGAVLQTTAHETVAHLIHFVSEGPADGYATPATKAVTPSGSPFPTSVVWSVSSKKLVEKLITYTGTNPTTIKWNLYAADGTTVLHSVTDTISYSGPFETTRSRAIT